MFFLNIHLDDWGQDRMTSVNVYEFNSVTRDHHIYKNVWTHDAKVYLLFITQPNVTEHFLSIDKMKYWKLSCKSIIWEKTNEHEEYAVDNWLQLLPIKDAIFATYQRRYQELICSFS